LGAVIVISGLLTAVFYVFSVRAHMAQANERVLQQLTSIDQNIRQQFHEALPRELRVLAASPVLDEYIMSSRLEKPILSKSVERLFLQALTYSRSDEQIAFVNVLGQEEIKVDRLGRRHAYEDLRETPLFRAVAEIPPFALCAQGPIQKPDGAVSYTIAIPKIDGDIGKFGGAVVVRYSLSDFFEALDRKRMYGENSIWVLGPEGQVLKQPANRSATFDPRPYLRGPFHEKPLVAPVPAGLLAYQDWMLAPRSQPLRVAISVPADLVLHDVWETLKFFLLVFLIAIIGTFLAARSLARYLSRPIVKLARAASRLARGEFSSTVQVEATGEVQLLVETFNRMVEELRKTTSAVHERAAELARSNAELEQFAYVASHDLQEPLRVVGSFAQLLAKRYRGQFGKDGDEFIAFIVDGVARMQQLIDDLLVYSRVGTRAKPLQPTQTSAVLEQAIANLQVAIDETGTVVTHDALPAVLADGSQLVQVFQNLLSNAIKFHGTEPPRVQVSAAREDHAWVFGVRDNGIGIDPQQFERIFAIFQRLHTSAEYPGTGIGLAVCKKIVERHGGRIWVSSQPGTGATFFFTVPDELVR